MVIHTANEKSIAFQISKLPFEEDTYKELCNVFSYNVERYLNGVTTDDYLQKELKNCLINFCEHHMPEGSNVTERKEFFGRLKSTLRVHFPRYPHSYVSKLLMIHCIYSIYFACLFSFYVRCPDIAGLGLL